MVPRRTGAQASHTLINGYTVNGQDRYAGIWDKSPGPGYVAHHGMTAAQYQQAFDSLGKQGMCLAQVSGYSIANQDRYAAIWESSRARRSSLATG